MTAASDISLVDRLLGLDTIKTWSLIATILGDLEDDCISGRALWSLLEPLGIKAEAMRVALHRLKKDGWVTSDKAGREVIYALSARGLVETQEARTDVYRRDVKYPEGWNLVLLGPDTGPIDGPHVNIDKSAVLIPVTATKPEHAAITPAPRDMPGWFQDCLVPQHMRDRAQDLILLASEFLQEPSTEAKSVRLMMLHHWRKMALRTGTWAHIGLQPDGVTALCHAAMRDVFEHTPRTAAKP